MNDVVNVPRRQIIYCNNEQIVFLFAHWWLTRVFVIYRGWCKNWTMTTVARKGYTIL